MASALTLGEWDPRWFLVSVWLWEQLQGSQSSVFGGGGLLYRISAVPFISHVHRPSHQKHSPSQRQIPFFQNPTRPRALQRLPHVGWEGLRRAGGALPSPTPTGRPTVAWLKDETANPRHSGPSSNASPSGGPGLTPG